MTVWAVYSFIVVTVIAVFELLKLPDGDLITVYCHGFY